MRNLFVLGAALCAALTLSAPALSQADKGPIVKTAQGTLEGKALPQDVHMFLGVPYAAPPVGDLRWKAPQKPAAWKGIREATQYGHRCYQFTSYPDMRFQDEGQSEDCLTLNIWSAAKSKSARLPVMVWIHGGGFSGGGSSEPRHDGQSLAHHGVVVVTLNYRLGMLGFFTHPELAKENPQHTSGNYGLMDQAAAVQWVKDNIAAFGGDPKNITIFGESAGSFSVSMLMASPLSKNNIAKAIGESGAGFQNRTLPFKSVAERQVQDAAAAKAALGTDDLAALRAVPADKLVAKGTFPQGVGFPPDIDGYVLPDTLPNLYAKGLQAHIPLIAGWNNDEIRVAVTRAQPPVTAASFREQAQKDFGDDAPRFLAAYKSDTDEDALRSAGDLMNDRFLVYSTWRWLDQQVATGGAPVYRYRLDLVPPPDQFHPLGSGAFHSDDIEYVFGALDARTGTAWTPADRTLSEQIQTYWTNFARTGNPNGTGVPTWPQYKPTDWQVMYLDNPAIAKPDTQRDHYLFLDSVWGK